MNKQDLLSFLKSTDSQQEASVVIAKDEKEIAVFEKELRKYKFIKAKDAFDLAKKCEDRGRFYLRIDTAFSKDAYDFLVQYPTRQIQLFHPGKMKLLIANPIYSGVSVVFLASREAVSRGEKQGMRLLTNFGMTYQS